jgi:hypothetical protein
VTNFVCGRFCGLKRGRGRVLRNKCCKASSNQEIEFPPKLKRRPVGPLLRIGNSCHAVVHKTASSETQHSWSCSACSLPADYFSFGCCCLAASRNCRPKIDGRRGVAIREGEPSFEPLEAVHLHRVTDTVADEYRSTADCFTCNHLNIDLAAEKSCSAVLVESNKT